MSVKKLPDWQMRFRAYLKENRGRDFEWGEWDCCIFANGCLKVISGKDVIPATLKWHDELSAMKAIRDYGETLDKALDKAAVAAGMYSVAKQYVTTGDLVVVLNDNKPVAGISDGVRVISPSDGGYAFSLPTLIEGAWRIPDG